VTGREPQCWLCHRAASAELSVEWDGSVLDYACADCRREYEAALVRDRAPRARLACHRWNADDYDVLINALLGFTGEQAERVIVGFPLVRPSEVLHWRERKAVLVAPSAWRTLNKMAERKLKPLGILDLRIERFGECPDHDALVAEFWEAS
jgi:hypothetical protein